MAYTTVAKIKSMFRNIKIEAATGSPNTETVITTEEVDQFIIDADSYIDTTLNQYYTTPITGSESLKIIDQISRLRVAHIIKGIMELTKQTSDKVQDVQGNLLKQSEFILQKLIPKHVKGSQGVMRWIDAEAPLTDAPAKALPPESSSLFSGPTATTRQFEKGEDNW